MIIDTHTHLFPESMRINRSAFFTDEPEFKLLYESKKSIMAGAEDLLRCMDEFKVDMAVICGFPWRNPEWAIMNNDYIIESVKVYPDRLKGLACFDALWEGAAAETDRCIDQGLCGAGELAFYLSGIDRQALDALTPVMDTLKKRGNLPCMIHTNEPIGHTYPGKTPVSLKQIYDLAREFPDNRIILAHWGGGLLFYNIMKKEVKQALKNVWFDTAASPFLYTPEIYSMARQAGIIDKVLLGTDYPLLKPDRYLNEIRASGIPEQDIEKICCHNARDAYF
ncbi:MAG: amidohydrolase [Desulfobacteraceae bacterium]|nr:MAG: amidohydrolase [Desulfobacteraceae bacterium]